jgi:transcriptional regulator with XRE-family HTH domain
MEIGTKIKKIRELKNYTQEYMAEQLNVSQPTYSRFEKDDSDITISQLEKISEILDMKVEDLINFNEKFVFNNYASNNANQAHIINQYMGDNEKKLYEDKIKLLEEKIQLLEKLYGK